MVGGERRRGCILGGCGGGLGTSLTLCSGRCFRGCYTERTRVLQGDHNDAWRGGGPSRWRHSVAVSGAARGRAEVQ
jgi:hypothetical protein